ncbi:hypothetical protein [Haloarcula amylovorans]|uniref:hypothetical protein n=1 Tax=Haloarcula amylovorans TaxID=2562280 RepID=UPI001075D46C|nr:hypothetical protein [Halomicroarcula amylolytica]
MDRTSLDESAATTYDQAVDHLEILLDNLEAATTDDQPTESAETPDEWEEQVGHVSSLIARLATVDVWLGYSVQTRSHHY